MHSQRITMKENISAAQNEKIDNQTAKREIKCALNRCINVAALYNKEQIVFIIIDIQPPLLVYTLDCIWNLPLHPRPQYRAPPSHQLMSDGNPTSCFTGGVPIQSDGH